MGNGRLMVVRLGCPADGAEGRGDFVEPRMALDGLGQLLDAGIDSALADAVAVGVTVDTGQCARFAHGEEEVVKLAVGCGDHGGDGAERVPAGGVFVGANVAVVWQVTGANTAGGVVVVVVVLVLNAAIGHLALLLFAGHEAEDGMGDLLLVELGLAGLVEISGRLAKLLVGEIVKRLVHGGGAGAESVTVKGTRDAGAVRAARATRCRSGGCLPQKRAMRRAGGRW